MGNEARSVITRKDGEGRLGDEMEEKGREGYSR